MGRKAGWLIATCIHSNNCVYAIVLRIGKIYDQKYQKYYIFALLYIYTHIHMYVYSLEKTYIYIYIHLLFICLYIYVYISV